jgi:hypothetical protein
MWTPHFLVMASSKVDFPDPFSPTKKAMGLLIVSSVEARRIGTLNG